MENPEKFYRDLDIPFLQEEVSEDVNSLHAIERATLCRARHQEDSFKYVLVVDYNPNAAPEDLKAFEDWHRGNESCDRLWSKLADSYVPPLEKGERRDEWMCLVQPSGSGLPSEFIRPGCEVILFYRHAPVEVQEPAEPTEPTKEFAIKILKFHPEKKGTHSFNVTFRDITYPLRSKGWKIVAILFEYAGEALTYSEIARMYSGKEPDSDKPSLAECFPLPTGEDKETNRGYQIGEQPLEDITKEEITEIVETINEKKGIEISYRNQGQYGLADQVRKEHENLYEDLEKRTKWTGNRFVPLRRKVNEEKAKNLIKQALKNVRNEARREFPEHGAALAEYLVDNLKWDTGGYRDKIMWKGLNLDPRGGNICGTVKNEKRKKDYF